MIIIDTHTHIYDSQFNDIEQVIKRAEEAGVSKLLLPAVDSESHKSLIALCMRYPDNCVAMMGLHPTSVNENPHFRDELKLVEKYLSDAPVRFCAVGEIGLDLYWNTDFLEQQLEVLFFQLELALKYDLSVVIHTRSAFEEMISALSEYKGRGLRGVFHSFSGSKSDYERMKSLGDFKFGIGGVVTYKKSAVADVLQYMELSDIVLETDSPYLPPVPYRGKRNESSYITYVAEKIAEIKGVTPEVVANITTSNACNMFGLLL